MAAATSFDDVLEWATASLAIASVAVAACLFGAFDSAYYMFSAGLIALASAVWLVRLWTNSQQRLLLLPIVWPLLLFLGYAIYRHQHSEIPYFSRIELAQTVVFALLGCLTVQNLQRQSVLKWGTAALVSVGVLLSAVAIFQCIRQSDTVFGATKSIIYRHRFGATFMNPNHLAGFLIPILSLSLSHLLLGRGGPKTRILYGYASVVILGGIGVTMSRAGWAGAAVTILCLGLWLARRPALRLPLAVGAVVLVGAVSFVLSNTKGAGARLDGLLDKGSKNSGYSRPWIWEPAWRMWNDHELLGVGAGQFDVHFPEYRPSVIQTAPEFVHNEYLNILVDYGAVGAVIALGGLVVAIWTVASGSKHMERGLSDLGTRGSNRTAFYVGAWAGLSGFAVQCIFEFDLHIPALALEVALVAGGLFSLMRYASERYWIRPHWALRIAITGAVIGAWWWTGPVVLRAAAENRRILDGTKGVKLRDVYLSNLRSALAIEPGNPNNYYLLGEGLRQLSWDGDENWRDYAGEAAEVLKKGTDINPHDSRMWLSLALTAGWLGDTNSASRYFDEASRRGGEDLTIANHHSWFRLQNGDPARAIELARQSTNWFIWGNWQPVYYISQAQAILDKQATNKNQ
ncbi:MAG TPA: O-antigen ligase family protein [Candidatus Limnocylindria bacterium]|nr:O-antigen ligase family protein [Candidatus Limnocylindria bacterium]